MSPLLRRCKQAAQVHRLPPPPVLQDRLSPQRVPPLLDKRL